jgi:uncharacterized protein DUF4404
VFDEQKERRYRSVADVVRTAKDLVMDKQRLHDTLEQLHGELEQIESVDENERQVLRELMSDINRLLLPGARAEQQTYGRLGERLREGIEAFEASHPQATMLMGQVMDALAKMGI